MPKDITARVQRLERMLPLVALLAWTQMTRAAVLKPADVDGFFVTPAAPSVLRWNVESGQLVAPVQYTIRDYWGSPVASGRATPAAGNTVEATVKLAQGFYELELPATKQQFGVVSLPAYSGGRDPLFCVDSALSWLVRDDQLRQGLVRVLRRSGVAMSRERLSWAQINPTPAAWQWEGSGRYEAVRRLYHDHHVAVLEMVHDAPAWSGKVGRYPKDLVGTARAWRQIAAQWRPAWGALEIWNEPDIHFGANLPADQYVSLVKTIAYALARRDRAELPLVGGAFAHCNRLFLQTAAENGLLDCVDAVSFHTYGRAPEMEALIGDYRLWLRAYGREAMPLWITECGRPWRRGPDRPPVDQDAASALDITMKAVEARAGGIARYFAFVYPFYEEGDNNFGMMGRRGTPLRSMAAYARLVSVLGHKRYLGDLNCDDPGLRRARVFGNDRETVAVLYTARPDAKARVKLGVPALRVEGIDGRTLEVALDGTVPTADGLTYVWLERQALGDRLRPDTPTRRLWTIAQQSPPQRPPSSPIVLRFEPDRGLMEGRTDGYHLTSKTPHPQAGPRQAGTPLPLKVRVFNLSTEPHELTLEPTFSSKSARLTDKPTRPVKLPAEGSADVAWEADLDRALAGGRRLEVTVSAQPRHAAAVAPLVISLVGQAR
jgi:hypothetical protein